MGLPGFIFISPTFKGFIFHKALKIFIGCGRGLSIFKGEDSTIKVSSSTTIASIPEGTPWKTRKVFGNFDFIRVNFLIVFVTFYDILLEFDEFV